VVVIEDEETDCGREIGMGALVALVADGRNETLDRSPLSSSNFLERSPKLRVTLVLCPWSLMLLLVTRDFPRGLLGRSGINGCPEMSFSAPNQTFSYRSKRPISRR
jgi:hypothetical protein